MIVVGLSGVAGVGKDVGAQALVEHCGFTRIAFADTLREAVYNLNPLIRSDDGKRVYDMRELIDAIGWERAKREYKMAREYLQRMGTEVGRQLIDDNVWVDVVFNRAKREGIDRLVIPDVRFPNELLAVNVHNGICFRVIRPGFDPVNAHASDNALFDGDFPDFKRIVNDSTEDEYQSRVIKAWSEWFDV